MSRRKRLSGRLVTLTLRQATPEDASSLVEGNARMAFETEGLTLDRDTLSRGVQAALRDPAKARYFVAEADGTVIGQLMITTEWSDWRNGWVWWIQSVYVVPEWRRRGVYRSLHEKVREVARAAGNVVGLRLYVHQQNEGAKRAYTRVGMKASNYEVFEELWEPK